MDLNRHPDLLDRLAASHALGSLRGGARRRFESMAREHPTVRAAAWVWQARIASLTELQSQQIPDPAVWQRIDRLVRAERQTALPAGAAAAGSPAAADTTPRWWDRLGWWRGAAAAGACATLLAVVAGWQLVEQRSAQVTQLQAQLQAVPRDAYVAVLHDDKSTASMLVTFDPRNNRLTLQRVGDYRESPERSLQLWAIAPSGGPRSLGVLDREPVLRLAAGEADVRDATALAISLEPRGGVPGSGGPTGPVLFSGRLIQKLP
ncbi:MAG: anti-sigma factor [Burkholderiaceae bacterium]|nr:anti-sigma factor [Rhodoferax sp.]MCB2007645.1 anti-sigma factor [Rhodoferax sp.]MCP5261529.1 anti-sigma factor [Rhodoferax sp.]